MHYLNGDFQDWHPEDKCYLITYNILSMLILGNKTYKCFTIIQVEFWDSHSMSLACLWPQL